MAGAVPKPQQMSPDELPDRVWDLVVAGAGPAGTAAAVTVAAGGYHVLLLDREAFPRDKVCGDGLLPDALAALERLGVGNEVARQGGRWSALSVWSPGRIEAVIPAEVVTLPRRALDAILVSRAIDLGACFARAEVRQLEESSGTVRLRVTGRETWITARLAVLATGARTQTMRRLGLSSLPHPPSAVGVRCYVRSGARIDRPLISYDREILPGYAWIFPLGTGVYNVGCGVFRGRHRTDLAETFQRFTSFFPPARDLLSSGAPLTPLQGAPLRCALHSSIPPLTGRTLVAGEALGTTLPFTGEGVGKALETGEQAGQVVARALETDDPELLWIYPRHLSEDFAPRYAGYQRAERWLSRGWVCDLLARISHRSSYLREAAGRILREEVPPSALFSATGLIRALLG